MATLPSTVRPGDVITADLMNSLLLKCSELERRIQSLEGTGSSAGRPQITSPTASDVFHLGDELRVIGRNFGSPEDNTVFIDTTVQVRQFKRGSGDGLLIFDIPFVQNIPERGRSVPLTLNNPRGVAATSFNLAQPQVTLPTGALTVSLSSSPSETEIEADSTYVFTYTITAGTTLDEVYDLTPRVDSGWQARVVDANNRPIVPQAVFIARPFAPTTPTVASVRVQATIPPGTPDGATGNLTLTVASQRNPSGLRRTSDPKPLTVGSAAPPAEDIVIALGSTIPATAQGPNDVILVSPGTPVFATFRVTVPEAGNYSVQPYSFRNDPGGLWSATHIGTQSGVFMQPPLATMTVQINARTGAPDAELVVRVVSDADAEVFGDIDQAVRLRSGA